GQERNMRPPHRLFAPGVLERPARGRRWFHGLSLLFAATLLLTACGGSPTASSEGGGGDADPDSVKQAMKVYEKFNSMSGEERHRALVKAAEEEGELSIYTSNDDIEDLISVFEDTYDIDVEVYRANSETVLQRLLQEQKAGYYGSDVFETNAGELNVANQQGMLADYRSELRDQVSERGLGDGWTASRYNVFVVGWNDNLVSSDSRPQNLEELAAPEWRGKVSMELGDFDWFAAMYRYYLEQGKSDAEIKQLFREIASNSKVVKGHTTQGELLSAGQFSVVTSSYSHTIDQAEAEGAPVKWRPPVEPVVLRPNGIGLMKTAKNPAAATLFVDFELTAGQKIFHDQYRLGAIQNGENPLDGLEVISTPDDELVAHPTKWDRLYAEIVRQGQEIEE
ncbi:MAG: ABC transporter substrate-binding protein, partial [Carbonactinosporaceae bacterium]